MSIKLRIINVSYSTRALLVIKRAWLLKADFDWACLLFAATIYGLQFNYDWSHVKFLTEFLKWIVHWITWSVTFVLTFLEALKGPHRADIVCECNSLKNFAFYVIKSKSIAWLLAQTWLAILEPFAAVFTFLRCSFFLVLKALPVSPIEHHEQSPQGIL